MRAKQLSIAVSAIILGAWLGTGMAQDAGAGANGSSPLDSMPAWQIQSYNDLPPGIVTQPQTRKPGLVAGIALGELYTDNLGLDYSGQPKQSDWITTVQPFIMAARSGPRFSGSVKYMLTGYAYADNSSDNRVSQNLDAAGRLTLVPQHLYLDGYAKYDHENTDNYIPPGYGAFYTSSGLTNVGVAQLSPFWQQNFGAAGIMTVRYSLGRVVYDRGSSNNADPVLFPDVTSNAVQFDLASPGYRKVGWDLGYAWQRLEPSTGQDVRFQSANVGLWYRVNQILRVVGDIGRENNYRADGSAEALGATRWDIGVQWDTPQNAVIAKIGHRFFGPSSEFSWTHTAARLSSVLRYEQRPTDINAELLGRNIGPGTIWPVNISQQYPNLTARGMGLYILRRGTFQLNYEMPNSKLSVGVADEMRSYFAPTDGPRQVYSANVAWMFHLGERTTLTPSVEWQRLRYEGGADTNPTTEQLVLMRQFTPHDYGTLRFRHGAWDYEQTMLQTNHNFDVNVIYGQWIHLF